MMKDAVAETCATVGTGSFALGGALNAGFNTFATRFTSGVTVYYFAKATQASLNGPKYEYGVGTFTSPSTITRADVKLSSNANAAVSWLATDTYIVYSAPSADALGALLIGNMATAKPTWAASGFEWLDSTAGVGVRLLRKLWNGSTDVETGRYHAVNGVYTAAQSMDVLDQGAANLTIADAHRDKFVYFNVTAASRTCTLSPVSSYARGFSIGVYGYGATGYNVALTPDAAEKINEGSVGVALNIAGGSPKIVRADHVRSAWIVYG